MDTRDRLEEVGKNINQNGSFQNDGKQLLDDYITKEVPEPALYGQIYWDYEDNGFDVEAREV